MNIRYSNHALVRLVERRISKADAEEVFRRGRKSDAQGGRRQSIHTIKNKEITVIYRVISAQEIEITTVY